MESAPAKVFQNFAKWGQKLFIPIVLRTIYPVQKDEVLLSLSKNAQAILFIALLTVEPVTDPCRASSAKAAAVRRAGTDWSKWSRDQRAGFSIRPRGCHVVRLSSNQERWSEMTGALFRRR